MKNLILIGGGGHAKACLDVVLTTKIFNVIGYIDIKKSSSLSLNYLGNDNEIHNYKDTSEFLITIGYVGVTNARKKFIDNLDFNNLKLAKIISPFSIVSKAASIGEGTIIMHGCIIQSDVNISKNCIINDGCIIEHDCIIEENCHISTNCTINGNVFVGKNSFIGSSSVIKNNLKIGDNCLIGQCSNVLINVKKNTKVFGNPAKEKK